MTAIIEGKKYVVKYAARKRGPIKVTKFNDLDQAKKFLAQTEKEGMKGIISEGENEARRLINEVEPAAVAIRRQCRSRKR